MIAETVALATMLLLVKATGARVHFAISSASGLEMVRDAKRQGCRCRAMCRSTTSI